MFEGPLLVPTPLDPLDACYRRYGPMVYRRCLQLLRDEGRAADVMQDVFVQLLRFRVDLKSTALSSLLNRIATNLCLNRLRSHKVRSEVGDELLSSIVESADLETRVEVARFSRDLFVREPASTQTIAVMHSLDGMTHEEVATEAGLSVGGVRKRLATLRLKSIQLGEV